LCNTSLCSKNLLVVTREEKLLLTTKAVISFPCYFGQKDVLECVGVREKARASACVGLYVILSYFSSKFSYAFPSF